MRSYAAVPPGRAVAYRHRDPAWVSPARLAELEARDRRREQLRAPVTQDERDALREARIRQYAALRDAGLRHGEAAAALGITRDAARALQRAGDRRKGAS